MSSRDWPYPQFFRVGQRFDSHAIDSVADATWSALDRSRLSARIRTGDRVAVAVGSRGIANLPAIVMAVVQMVQRLGGDPFIVPAMGSHGGATAEGQTAMLASLGITADRVGAPIESSMDTVILGTTEDGLAVHFDRIASGADHVIAINRVKPHTRLVGSVESGIAKMLMIGLGKHRGAALYHQAFGDLDYRLDRLTPTVIPMILDQMPIAMTVAVVEDAFEQTAMIEAIEPDRVLDREPELLAIARDWMPGLPFDLVDFLVVDRIGKEISGTGMDTNVIGRKSHDKAPGENEFPKVKQIYVRSLTAKTSGNATGIGIAEYCHRDVVDAMDHRATRVNCVTGQHVTAGAIPLAFDSDRDVFDAVLSQFGRHGTGAMKWMRIRDTLHLGTVACSDAYWDLASGRSDLEILDEPAPMLLDERGNLVAPFS